MTMISPVRFAAANMRVRLPDDLNHILERARQNNKAHLDALPNTVTLTFTPVSDSYYKFTVSHIQDSGSVESVDMDARRSKAMKGNVWQSKYAAVDSLMKRAIAKASEMVAADHPGY